MTQEDLKASNKIRNIWFGEDFSRCDGSIEGYSCMTKILNSSAMSADPSVGFTDIISAGFDRTGFYVDYSF